jgi:sugar/nucleoside kinase (ribokinase family)
MVIDTSHSIDAVVAGYFGVDMAPGFAQGQTASFAEMFRPGRLIETEGLHFSLGGVVANTGLAMRKFGTNTVLSGWVGNDALGDIAVAQLESFGVSGIARKDSAGTAYGIVIAPPGTDRIFLEDPGCNHILCADDIDYELVAKSRLFHFGYPPLMEKFWSDGGAELKKMLERVHAEGTVISLDMTLPDANAPAGKADWQAILTEVLPLVDIFVPSIEELLFMLEPELYAKTAKTAEDGGFINAIPLETYHLLAERVFALGVNILLIKAGHKGAYIQTNNIKELNNSALQLSDVEGCPNGIWLSPLAVDAERFCNASGAGDCAVAGFLTALLNDEKIITAGKYAMLAGRDNLYGQDAISGLTDWPRMKDLIKCDTSCRKHCPGY